MHKLGERDMFPCMAILNKEFLTSQIRKTRQECCMVTIRSCDDVWRSHSRWCHLALHVTPMTSSLRVANKVITFQTVSQILFCLLLIDMHQFYWNEKQNYGCVKTQKLNRWMTKIEMFHNYMTYYDDVLVALCMQCSRNIRRYYTSAFYATLNIERLE